MKLFSVIIAILCLASFANGQYAGEPSDPQSEILKREGKILSINLTKGQPLRIFILGKEEAKFDVKDFELTVRRIKPYPAKKLQVDSQGNYFVVDELTQNAEEREVEIKARLKEKTETIRLKIPAKKP